MMEKDSKILAFPDLKGTLKNLTGYPFTRDLLYQTPLERLAEVVNGPYRQSERIKCAEALYARMHELNGMAWVAMLKKAEVKRAMVFVEDGGTAI